MKTSELKAGMRPTQLTTPDGVMEFEDYEITAIDSGDALYTYIVHMFPYKGFHRLPIGIGVDDEEGCDWKVENDSSS